MISDSDSIDPAEGVDSVDLSRREPSDWPTARDGLAVTDLDGVIVMANAGLQTMHGAASPSELVGKSSFELIAPSDRDRARQVMREAATGPRRTEFRLLRLDGSVFLADVQANVLRDARGEPAGVLAIIRDLGAADETDEIRRRFEQVASSASDHIAYIDRDYIYRAVNDAFLEAHGLDRANVVGRTVAAVVGDEEFERTHRPALDRCFGGLSNGYEATAPGTGSNRGVLDVQYYPCHDDQGAVTGAAMVARDVTARKRAESQLRRSERRYRRLVERAPFGVVVTKGDGLIVSANPKACRILGRTEDRLVGSDARLLIGDVPAEQMEGLWQTLGDSGGYEGVELTTVTGRTLRVSSAVLDRRSRTRMSLFEDVTRRLQLERQVSEAHKMEAIGTLAGGVAHEMNNVLAVVLGLTSAMQSDLEPDHVLQEDIIEILAATRRGKSLTQNLLGFARRGRYRKERTSLRRVVDAVHAVLRRTVPKDVHVELSHSDVPLDVECDVAQVTQALLNVCLNALDAMGAAGRLAIATQTVELGPEGRAARLELPPGRYVEVSVSDDGHGMDLHTVKRAFEPFFTTKEVGKGTGLGLSMAYGVAKRHEGAIEIRSAEGRGTTVTMLLPLLDPRATAQDAERDVPRRRPRRDYTVLLVDDELMIRNSARRLLDILGFDVVLASGGRDALQKMRSHPSPIDVVLLDVVMPEMDGVACYHAIRSVAADVPVLFCTGHADDVRLSDLAGQGVLGVLRKPFDLAKLRDTLDAALTG